jgi:hypothetical protein
MDLLDKLYHPFDLQIQNSHTLLPESFVSGICVYKNILIHINSLQNNCSHFLLLLTNYQQLFK